MASVEELRRNGKSSAAFRTISEVASDLDVPQHVLRFWETKFTQVRPLKRGGGRRYYRPEDVDLLRRIRTLLYENGYTIRGVQKLLRETGGRITDIALVGGVASAVVELEAESEGEVTETQDIKTQVQLRRLLRELVEVRDLLKSRLHRG
ncbi:MAG: MerR family transcriptional regulator [Alphaproteobacteria bacterium]